MPQFNLYGVEVFYRDIGAGTPVVLGHSSAGSSGQWRNLIALLSDRYRVLAPDHLGYGRTGAYPGAPDLYEIEVSIIEKLISIAGRPTHLVGHSYGGALMARTAVRNPDQLQSLSLIEPTLFHLLLPAGRKFYHDEIRAVADRVIKFVDDGNLEDAARGFIDYWVTEGAYDRMDDRARNAVIESMPKLRVEFPEGFRPWNATTVALGALKVPIQLIKGTRTTNAAHGVISLLLEIWPNCDYQVIDRAGHMSPLTHAGSVNSAIERFLDSVSAEPNHYSADQ